jgi:hypothetical protein
MNTAELVRTLIVRMQETNGTEPVPLSDIEELECLLALQEVAR